MHRNKSLPFLVFALLVFSDTFWSETLLSISYFRQNLSENYRSIFLSDLILRYISLFPIFQKSIKDKTFKFSAIIESLHSTVTVPFVRRYFLSSPYCNEKLIFYLSCYFIVILWFYIIVDRNAVMNVEYVNCFKID